MTRTVSNRLLQSANDSERGGTFSPDVRPTAWSHQHEPRFRAICDRVAAAGEDLRVLEVGAAPYHLTNELLGLDAVADLTVINRGTSEDVDKTGTVRLPNGSADVRYCNVEAMHWPVDSSSYDVIVMGAILEHLHYPSFALHQARMAVREAIDSGSSRLILSTPNALRLIRWGRIVTRQGSPDDGLPDPRGGTIYDRHIHEYTRAELADVLERAGWNPVQIESVQLNRPGRVGSIYERVAGIRDSWGDQWVVDAHAGTQWGGSPMVCHEPLTEREAGP